MENFCDIALFGKLDLEKELGKLNSIEGDLVLFNMAENAGVNTHGLSREDCLWSTSLALLQQVKWSEPLISKEYSVPTKEPESRVGFDDIQWPKLRKKTEARACLQTIMKKYNVWDSDELVELLYKIKGGEITEQRVGDTRVLESCLKILTNAGKTDDTLTVGRYYIRHQKERQEKLQKKLHDL